MQIISHSLVRLNRVTSCHKLRLATSWDKLQLLNSCDKLRWLGKRYLTLAEVSTALRPFYFLVHPDLFGKYPQAQDQNEKSLKTLKNFVDTLVEAKARPNPKEVLFYIKPRSAEEKEKQILRSVKIRLRGGNIRETVVRILQHSGLPTGYVDEIPKDQSESVPEARTFQDEFYYGEAQPETTSPGFSSTDIRQPFIPWLSNNIEKARLRFVECEPIRLETERLQGELCYNFGLNDILWDCGWDTHHRRGAALSFKSLATQHPDVQDILRGRRIVFGKNSGVSTRGDIVLYSGEVRSNWLKIIKNSPGAAQTLVFLPLYEKALSQALNGMQLVQQGEENILVEEYRDRLRKLVTALADYRVRRRLPESWPEDMSEYKLSAESESSALMLSPDGVFVIPASTPGFLIVEFIQEHRQEAKRRIMEDVTLHAEESLLMTKCINELGLIQLDRDDSITSAQMIYNCKQLLRQVPKLRHLTHGSHIIVTRYYMVKSDGSICIPWELKYGEDLDNEEPSQESISKHLYLY